MRKAVWAFVALTGCAGHGVHPLRPLDLPTAPFVEGTAVETLSGSLTFDEGCLIFRARGGERLLTIWPRSSVFNGTSLMFRRPGKTEHPLLVNEEVEISGMRVPLSYFHAYFPQYETRCGGVPFFVAKVRPAD